MTKKHRKANQKRYDKLIRQYRKAQARANRKQEKMIRFYELWP